MPIDTTANIGRPRVISTVQWIGLIIGIIVFLIPFFIEFQNLSPAGHRMLSIFFLAIVFWLAEVVPMFATAVLIILLEILFLSNKGIFIPHCNPAVFTPVPYKKLLAALADPVIILFMGGFFLADGATKYRMDRNLARVMLKPFGTRPSMIILGFMLITAIFSMFMSNTATTATFMAVMLPVMAGLPKGDRLRIALPLCIPIAANIGGIGTPIGTPPNAIALGALAKASPDGNAPIAFIQWMTGAVPLMLIFLTVAFIVLNLLFKSDTKHIKIELDGSFDKSPQAFIFYATFAGTVILWMTEALHGINSNIVGFIPIVVLSCTRVMGISDLKNLEWHVLWLVAGGISLGIGIGATGMGEWFVGLFDWTHMTPFVLVSMLTLASLICSTFISNSATTNLLVPIALSLTISEAVPLSPVAAAVFIAVGSSMAMALPISTPPNAIAYACGEISARNMAITGSIIGGICWLIFILIGPSLWEYLGILPH